MELMQSWKRSLQVLRPDRLKPLLMVTAKTAMGVYEDMNHPLTSQGKWLMVGIILCLILLTNIIQAFYLFWFEGLLLNTIHYFLLFMFVLGMRASVGRKNKAYFLEYLYRFRYALAGTLLIGMTPLFAIPFLLQWWIFFLFFLFDTGPSLAQTLKAKGQATKLVLYNLPLCAILEIVLRSIGYLLLNKLVGWSIGWGGLTIAVIMYIVVIPIQVALISNLYIILFHDQPDVYFKQHLG